MTAQALDSAPPWSLAPEGWALPSSQLLERATATARRALADTDLMPVGQRLAAHYEATSEAPNALWSVLPADPYDLGPSDLFALSVLGHTLPVSTVRCLLESTPERRAVLAALRRVDPVNDLVLAGPSELQAMELMLIDIKSALHIRSEVAWAAASGLCARLRPALFPLATPATEAALGLPRGVTERERWLLFRHLLNDEATAAALRRTTHPPKDGALHRAPWADEDLLTILVTAISTFAAPD